MRDSELRPGLRVVVARLDELPPGFAGVALGNREIGQVCRVQYRAYRFLATAWAVLQSDGESAIYMSSELEPAPPDPVPDQIFQRPSTPFYPVTDRSPEDPYETLEDDVDTPELLMSRRHDRLIAGLESFIRRSDESGIPVAESVARQIADVLLLSVHAQRAELLRRIIARQELVEIQLTAQLALTRGFLAEYRQELDSLERGTPGVRIPDGAGRDAPADPGQGNTTGPGTRALDL